MSEGRTSDGNRDAARGRIPPSTSFVAWSRGNGVYQEHRISADGLHVAVVGRDPSRRIQWLYWDGVSLGAYSFVQALALSPAGGRVAFWGARADNWPLATRWSLVVDGRPTASGERGLPEWWRTLPSSMSPGHQLHFSEDGSALLGDFFARRELGTHVELVGEGKVVLEAMRRPMTELSAARFAPDGQLVVLGRGRDSFEIRVDDTPTGLSHVFPASLGFSSTGALHFAGQDGDGKAALYVDGRRIALDARPTGIMARTGRGRLAYVVHAGRQEQLIVDDRVRAAYQGIPFLTALDAPSSFVFIGADQTQSEVHILGQPRSEPTRSIVGRRVAIRSDEACVAYTEMDDRGDHWVVTRPTTSRTSDCASARRGPFRLAGVPAFVEGGLAFMSIREEPTAIDESPRGTMLLHLPGGTTAEVGPAETWLVPIPPVALLETMLNAKDVSGRRIFAHPSDNGAASLEPLAVWATADGRLGHLGSADGSLCFVARRPVDTRPLGPGCRLGEGGGERSRALDRESDPGRDASSNLRVMVREVARAPLDAAVSVSLDLERIATSGPSGTFVNGRPWSNTSASCLRFMSDGRLAHGRCRDGGVTYSVDRRRLRVPPGTALLLPIENGGGMLAVYHKALDTALYLPEIRRSVPMRVEGLLGAWQVGTDGPVVLSTIDGLYEDGRRRATGMGLSEIAVSADGRHYLASVIEHSMSSAALLLDGAVVHRAERVWPIGFDDENRPVYASRNGDVERVHRGDVAGRPYRAIRAQVAALDHGGRHLAYVASSDTASSNVPSDAENRAVVVLDETEHRPLRGIPRTAVPSTDGRVAWVERSGLFDYVVLDGKLVATVSDVDDESVSFTGDGDLFFRALVEHAGRKRWFLYVGAERYGPFDHLEGTAMEVTIPGGEHPARPDGRPRVAYVGARGTDRAFYLDGSRCGPIGETVSEVGPRLHAGVGTVVARDPRDPERIVRMRCEVARR